MQSSVKQKSVVQELKNVDSGAVLMSPPVHTIILENSLISCTIITKNVKFETLK